MDISRGELVKKEVHEMIERRSRQKDPEEASEAWQESERRHEEQRRLQARNEWHLYHTAQAERVRRTLEEIVSHHEEQAAKLMDVQPKGAA
jgi:DNA-directed RNA polymerase subunit F